MYDSAVRSQHSRPAVPTAPAGNATAPLAQSLNSSPRVAAQRALANRLNVAQRAVPENSDLPKPVAVTVPYNPQGNDVAFDTTIHTRADVAFAAGTRPYVLERSHPVVVNGEIESVRVATGTQENVKGVQLDHRYAWDRIATNMHNRNVIAHNQNRSFAYKQYWYTLRDARLYYNDYTNLQPVLGSDNAAAGAGGVVAAPPIHNDLAAAVATTHGGWMRLQRDVNRLGADPAQLVREDVVERLQNTRNTMAETATAIENHLNPPVVNADPMVVDAGNAIIPE